MIKSFSNHLRQNFPEVSIQNKLLIAFSGGVDSVVLSELLMRLGYHIYLAHVNFSLRGEESDSDAAFTDAFAKRKKIPLYYKKVDTKEYADEHGLSTQEAAREIRYSWFSEIVKSERLDFILTAHHADDQLETLFINLIRGTGLKGFTGIPEKRNNILRPLLPFRKDELLAFAVQKQISWREDSSNQSSSYLRNKVRHQLIPHFEDVDEYAFQQAQKSINLAKDAYYLFDELIKEKYDDIVSYKNDRYFICVTQLRREKNVKILLYHFIKSFGFSDADKAYKLLEKPKAKFISNTNYRIIKERDYLVIEKIKTEEEEKEHYVIPLENGIHKFPSYEITLEHCYTIGKTAKNIAYVDNSKLNEALILRRWKEGDSFRPLGMKGSKKISDFLKDENVASHLKKDQLVLTHKDEIIWVVNHRIDEKFKVSSKTKKCLKISYTAY